MKTIVRATFLLAWIAGFCDTVTFVAGDNIFSAHVTGNFIVFAAQVLSGQGEASWIKLLTFPVFVIAVIVGGWMAEKIQDKYKILWFESVLLIIGSLIGLILPRLGMGGTGFCMYLIVLITVFALGLQNTFGRLFAKETFGPTTIMTGNVTQASMDLGTILRKGKGTDAWLSLKKLSVTIGGFLVGCFFGAWLGKAYGLATIGIPGMILFATYFSRPRQREPRE